MAGGHKNRRGVVLGTRKRFVIGTDTEVKRVQLRGTGRTRFVWMDANGNFHPTNTTELAWS